MDYFNQYLFNLIYRLSNRNFFLDDFGVFCAQDFLYILILLFLILVFKEKGTRKKLFFFSEALISVIVSRGIITELIRLFYHHLRPSFALNIVPLINESGYSFPSGHATFLFTLSMTVFFYNKKWGIWFLILSLINGIARIYVGVHWPLDILGGILLGTITAFIIHLLLNKSRKAIFIKEPVAE
jgi:undecaprenyl-diphosphatase